MLLITDRKCLGPRFQTTAGIFLALFCLVLRSAAQDTRPDARYQDPAVPALNILYVGMGRFLDETGRGSLHSELENGLFGFLKGEPVGVTLAGQVTEFFRQVAATHPELRLRVLDPKKTQIIAETIDHTAFASLAFDQAAVLESAYRDSLGADREIYLSLPLFLVGAKSHELLYARPIFIRVKLAAGVSPQDPVVHARILDEIQRVHEAGARDARTVAVARGSLLRGSFRNPNQLTYHFAPDAITFSDKAARADTGLRQPADLVPLLRQAASHHLARSHRVFPPLKAAASNRLLRELGAPYFGLEVITDLTALKGLPYSDSGRLILPVSHSEADIQIKLLVKTGVQFTGESRDTRLGQCQVILEALHYNARKQLLQSNQFIGRPRSFTTHKTLLAPGGESCLIEAALAATEQLTDGF